MLLKKQSHCSPDIATACDEYDITIFEQVVDRQAAMYLDGWSALGRNYEHFVFICVEKEPPFAVALYRPKHNYILTPASTTSSVN